MGGFQCQSVSVSKRCHARCSQCESVPGGTIGNCAKISVSDQLLASRSVGSPAHGG